MQGVVLVGFWLTVNLVVGVVSSFPSSYAFDFILSNTSSCAVRVENPLARTGLGFAGAYAGGAGWWLAGISKVVEMTVPKTAEVFHGERCN